MKTVLLHIFFLLSVTMVSAQPTLEFKENCFDMGKIPENGESVIREFRFRNTGNQPLVILRTNTACGCTKATSPKAPVRPGQEGVIRVVYNPRKQNGTFSKAISIYTNTPEKRHIVTIRGTVVPTE